MATITESATLALNAEAKRLAAEGRPIYNLTAGELADDTPDYIQEAVAKNLSHNKYTPVAGLPELRQQISEHAREFYSLSWIRPENVVVTGGAKPALHAAFMALIDPGDEVIVPTPAWLVSYRPLIELVGGVVIEVPLTDQFDLDTAAIAAKISDKTRAIVINTPNNPTGAVFSQKALRETAELANRHGLYAILDDIYSKLVYETDFLPAPMAGFNRRVIINGFSKSQALTGWRIGYLIAEKNIAEACTSLLSHMTGNASLPGQYAALAALERNDKPPASTLKTLKQHRQLAIEGLKAAGIKHNNPGGAFYIFLDLRELSDNSSEWCQRLLSQAGVALVPGEAFGAPGWARLTFVADEATLTAGLEQIKKFVRGVA